MVKYNSQYIIPFKVAIVQIHRFKSDDLQMLQFLFCMFSKTQFDIIQITFPPWANSFLGNINKFLSMGVL